jgi:hypothetical protein
MRDAAKWTVTLAMLWIGALGIAAQPELFRRVRDNVMRLVGRPVPSMSGGGSADVQP